MASVIGNGATQNAGEDYTLTYNLSWLIVLCLVITIASFEDFIAVKTNIEK